MAKSVKLVAVALFVLLIAPASAQNVVAGKSGEPASAPPTKAEPDAAGGIRVRVGVPYVARGPGAIADSWFTEVKLPDGRYRGFTALGSMLAIDGKEPYSMGGGTDARLDDIRNVIGLRTDLDNRGAHHHRNGPACRGQGHRRLLSDRDQRQGRVLLRLLPAQRRAVVERRLHVSRARRWPSPGRETGRSFIMAPLISRVSAACRVQSANWPSATG